jgi:hypothetical protein
MLTADTLPVACRDVVTRSEPGGVLLFQVRTDEMFFATRSAFALFSLCDGTRTVSEIERELEAHDAERRARVERFLTVLAERSLIELWS